MRTRDSEHESKGKAARFGCGLVFGAVAAALGLAGFNNLAFCLAVVVISGALFGALSVRFGDAFWRVIVRIASWW